MLCAGPVPVSLTAGVRPPRPNRSASRNYRRGYAPIDVWGNTVGAVDTGLNSSGGVRRRPPAGFTTRRAGDAAGLWHEFAEYPDGRLGVVVGSCADGAEAERLRAGTSSRLRDGADPEAVLGGFESPSASVLAAVIDRADSRMRYGSLGVAAPALAAPGEPHHTLEPTNGRSASVSLPPGATVVLSTYILDGADAHPDDRWPTGSEQLLDELLAGFSARRAATGAVVVLYRHPPAPLDLIVPAEAGSLTIVRRRLRSWLGMTGADNEACADILLAVGEAATNAAEHAHDGTGRSVKISLQAEFAGGAVRFTVSDNGSWRTPVDSDEHRGHGIRLMRALVDGVDITTSAQGTTVTMLKDIAG